MSSDKTVTKDLMKTLEDGKEGFEKAATLLESEAPQASMDFQRFAQQRATFYSELQELASDYGDELSESGTLAAALHRGWMGLKDAVTGSSLKSVLDAAEQGEEHAVEEYEKALEQDLSEGLRSVVDRQLTDIRTTHEKVRALQTNHS